MGAHTKGQWEIINGRDIFGPLGGDSGDGVCADWSDGWQVAEVSQYQAFVDGQLVGMSRAVMLANARLIAAAPDLLEALEAAVDCGMVPSSSLKDGGAARHARQVHAADMIRAAITKAKGETQ